MLHRCYPHYSALFLLRSFLFVSFFLLLPRTLPRYVCRPRTWQLATTASRLWRPHLHLRSHREDKHVRTLAIDKLMAPPANTPASQAPPQVTDYSVFDGDHALEKPTNKDDFIWSEQEEPHASRRKAILKKYSSKINKLYGYEPMTKYIAAGVVFLQLGTAYYLRDKAFTWEFWVIA